MAKAVQAAAINKYSSGDLKNTCDDNIPQILESLGYKQDHSYEDKILIISSLSAIIAGLVFYVEKVLTFKGAYNIILIGVVAYSVLSALAYLYRLHIGKGLVYVGRKEDEKVIVKVYSHTEKSSPEYEISFSVTDSDSKILAENTAVGEFNEWFDENGWIVYKKFSNWIVTHVPKSDRKVL